MTRCSRPQKSNLKAQVARVAELAAKSKAAPKGKKKSLSASEKKALEQLIEAWEEADELKRAFIKASPNVRKKFLAKICQE